MLLWEKTFFMLFHLSTFQSMLYIHGLRRLFVHSYCFFFALAVLSYPTDVGPGQDLLWLMEYE